MTRFAVDIFDVLLDLLRPAMPLDVTVMSRIPDYVAQHLPVVVIGRIGGSSQNPEFFDRALVNVQCWADTDRAASDLADQVRGILWDAYRTQQVVPGRGWIGSVRESVGPREVPDADLPLLGRYIATYEIRVRGSA